MDDYDPRIVDLYDLDNPGGPDHDFYRDLADRLGARIIVDLGCGTGILTVSLATPGRTVLGVDPSPTMLEYARRRDGADHVRWLDGDSSAIDVRDADFVVMTGNVAQHILAAGWPETLADVRRALRPGGVVAFESRNPADRAWADWAAEAASTRDTPHGPLTEWTEVLGPDPEGQVELRFHNAFERTGDELVEVEVLAFRDRSTLERQLSEAGLVVDHVWGDWSRTPFRGTERIMVFQARRP
jgi:SAM-dependent methyltransferase